MTQESLKPVRVTQWRRLDRVTSDLRQFAQRLRPPMEVVLGHQHAH
jgi:hypothetical protein